MSKEEQKDIMRKRGTWENYGRNNYKNDSRTQQPNKATTGRANFGHKDNRKIKNIKQADYDYEREESETEEEIEAGHNPKPSINSIMTSI